VSDYWHRQRLSRRGLLIGSASAGASAFLLAACGGDDESSASGAAATPAVSETPVGGGKIALNGSDPVNLDFHTQTGPVYWTLHSNRLLKYRTGPGVSPNQYDLVGDLATSWESPDPLKVTFKLNPNAKFHNKAPVNGRVVTSEDVKRTLTLMNTERNDYIFRYLVDYIDRIDTPDAQTVSLTLKQPTPLVFSYLAYYNAAIAPVEIIDRDKNLQKDDIGTGPYIFSQAEKSVVYKFTKNPDYFGNGGPYIDEISFSVISDANSALDNLRTGNLDALDVGFEQLDVAEKTISRDTATLQTVPGIGWFALWFNTLRPLFKDLRTRQAFQYAVDRNVVNSLAGRNKAAIRTGPISRGWSWSRDESAIQSDAKRDVAKAKQLLSAAGYDGGLKVDFMAISSHIAGANGNMVQVFQQQLKDAGIDITINPTERTAALARLSSQDYDLGNWSIRAYPDPDDYLSPFFLPGGSKNFGGTNDPALTALVTRQKQEADPAKRKAILQEIDSKWQSDFAYALWGLEFPFSHIHNNRLGNYSGRNPSDLANFENAFVRNA
jgi:peptide/nickel transport system substrate-binding protein